MPTPSIDILAADAPVGPDHLAGAVLRSLQRPLTFHRSPGPLRTLVLSLITLGVYPLFEWSRLLRDFGRLERQQLWHLAEWLRLQTGSADAKAMRDAADRMAGRRLLDIAAAAWVLAVIAAGVMHFAQGSLSLGGIYSATYGQTWDQQIASFTGGAPALFAVWTIGLTLAYMLHWLQVQLWAGDVRRVAALADPIWRTQGISEVQAPRLGPGLSVGWMLGCVAMVLLGAWWGVGLMLAGGAQRRYTTGVNPRLRLELGQRVQLMLQSRRPPLATPMPLIMGGACRSLICRAALPAGAAFCPRCGMRVATRLSEVA